MSASVSRRELLKWASAGAGAAAVGGATYLYGRGDTQGGVSSSIDTIVGAGSDSTTVRPPGSAPLPASGPPIADIGQRLLVVVEMGGGNDGMSMVAPYGLPGYYDLRPRTAIGDADVLTIDDEVGYHFNLKNVHRRGAAIIEGVGATNPDGSHFEMMARWWNGSSETSNRYPTGWLGRLADAIGDPGAAAVGLAIGSGSHPALLSSKVSTLTIPSADSAGYIVGADEGDILRQRFQRSFYDYGLATPSSDLDARLRYAKVQAADFASMLLELDDENGVEYPGSTLGSGLRLAARLSAADNGVRIIHVPMSEDFDTHDDHSGRYPGLMDVFDTAIDAFFSDLEQRGIADRVLLMTTSEFGRTAADNGSGGLDHGAASSTLLMGPVNPGRFGAHPSLTELDDNGNLQATVSVEQYFATIAEGWFGVPASDVVDGNVNALQGIF